MPLDLKDPKVLAAATALGLVAGGAALFNSGIFDPKASFTVDPDHLYVDVAWPDGKPSDTSCKTVIAYSLDAGVDLLGLKDDAGPYTKMIICAGVVDAGLAPNGIPRPTPIDVPPGFVVAQAEAVASSADFQLEAWVDSKTHDGGDGFECACSVGDGGCEWKRLLADGGEQWENAITNTTFNPGEWRGTACRRKTCVELAGFPPDTTCPLDGG